MSFFFTETAELPHFEFFYSDSVTRIFWHSKQPGMETKDANTDPPNSTQTLHKLRIQKYLEDGLAWFRDKRNSKEAHILHPHILLGFSKAFLSFLLPTLLLTRKVCALRRFFIFDWVWMVDVLTSLHKAPQICHVSCKAWKQGFLVGWISFCGDTGFG